MEFPALSIDDPKTQGILALAAGLLQAGGPSRTPVNFGQALGQGALSGLSGYQSAQQAAQQAQLVKLHAQLYGAQAGKLNEDIKRQQRLGQIMTNDAPMDVASTGGTLPAAYGQPGFQPGVSQPRSPSPLDMYKAKASQLVKEGFFKEGNELAEFITKMEPKLEFKDGVWYDKTSGSPVRGGAFVNQQGFGGLMNVGPNGQISMGPLAGAAERYGEQQGIGARTSAAYDLVTVPATGPNSPPTYASRLSLLPGQGGAPAAPVGPQGAIPPARPAAGMSPADTAAQAANAAQQLEISKNYGSIYNSLQNASMANPGKIAKVQRIGTLLGDFEGGKFSGTGLEIARGANSLGLKIDQKLPNKEAAQALTNEVALELRSTADGHGMPGAMSDADREFLKAMTPQMAQTAEGRKTIIESKVKVMQRENQVAEMARQYKKKYGSLNEDFFTQLSGWSERNPMFKK